MTELGTVWLFGDDIDTDILAPGKFMSSDMSILSSHCLEAVDASFAKNVQSGDILVAGKNFGVGSSREQAAQALKYLGIKAVIAKSFAGIFYRNAINLGLPVLVGEVSDVVRSGDRARLEVSTGVFELVDKNKSVNCEPLPKFLFDLIESGGLVPHLERRFAEEKNSK
jgi:3-isopropylmalate/(R)-2-methylmalate dehydratase small subunit